MANCGGCNDGCFDESIELQVGPAGAAGATGSQGAQGDPGIQGDQGIQGDPGNNEGLIDYKFRATPITDDRSVALGQIDTWNIPADTWGDLGDTVIVEFDLVYTGNQGVTNPVWEVELEIGTGLGNYVELAAYGTNLITQCNYIKCQVYITQTASGTLTPYVTLLAGIGYDIVAATYATDNVGISWGTGAYQLSHVAADLTGYNFANLIPCYLRAGVDVGSGEVKLIRAHYYKMEKTS